MNKKDDTLTELRTQVQDLNGQLKEMNRDLDKILLLLVGTQQEVQEEKKNNSIFRRRVDATIKQILWLLKL